MVLWVLDYLIHVGQEDHRAPIQYKDDILPV